MLYKLELDENNYIVSFMHTGTIEDKYELNASTMNLDYLNCYKLMDNEVIFDEEKYNTLISRENIKQEVEALKNQLADTDYKITKSMEYYLCGLEVPYDIQRLHKEKQALRDRINELEN